MNRYLEGLDLLAKQRPQVVVGRGPHGQKQGHPTPALQVHRKEVAYVGQFELRKDVERGENSVDRLILSEPEETFSNNEEKLRWYGRQYGLTDGLFKDVTSGKDIGWLALVASAGPLKQSGGRAGDWHCTAVYFEAGRDSVSDGGVSIGTLRGDADPKVGVHLRSQLSARRQARGWIASHEEPKLLRRLRRCGEETSGHEDHQRPGGVEVLPRRWR